MPFLVRSADPLPFGLHDAPIGLLLAFLFVLAFCRGATTYGLGRAAAAGGRRSAWLRRRLDGATMRRAEAFAATWGVFAVPLSFLTVGLQTAINASAGATRLPLRRYIPALVVGAAMWAVLYATVGLAAVATALGLAARSPWALVGLVVLVVVVVVVYRRRRRVAAARDAAARDAASPGAGLDTDRIPGA